MLNALFPPNSYLESLDWVPVFGLQVSALEPSVVMDMLLVCRAPPPPPQLRLYKSSGDHVEVRTHDQYRDDRFG